MPTKKIGEVQRPCTDSDHMPPSMMVYEPGEYEHTCRACGHKIFFRVDSPVWAAAPGRSSGSVDVPPRLLGSDGKIPDTKNLLDLIRTLEVIDHAPAPDVGDVTGLAPWRSGYLPPGSF